jgi:hypothetical protein
MDYHQPILTRLALDVGVSCCTQGTTPCDTPPPTCPLGPIVIRNLDCGKGVPEFAACASLPNVRLGPIHLGGTTCI